MFWATDRTTNSRRKVWKLQSGPSKKNANTRKAEVEVALRASGGLWPAEEPQPEAITSAAYREAWIADRAGR